MAQVVFTDKDKKRSDYIRSVSSPSVSKKLRWVQLEKYYEVYAFNRKIRVNKKEATALAEWILSHGKEINTRSQVQKSSTRKSR